MKVSPYDYYSHDEIKKIRSFTEDEINRMSYVKFISLIKEVNKPPGGLSYLLRLIRMMGISERSSVLDVGCNTGYVSFELSHFTKCKVVGIDIDKDMIRTANKIKKFDSFKKRIVFKVADAKNLPFASNTFDFIMDLSEKHEEELDTKEKYVSENVSEKKKERRRKRETPL